MFFYVVNELTKRSGSLHGAARRIGRRRVAFAGGAVAAAFVAILAATSESTSSSPAVAPQVSVPASQPTTSPTTQPADQFYDPLAEGADPAWALPAELTTEEAKSLIKKLDELIPYLQSRGIAMIDDQPVPRMGARGIGLSIYVLDPDGYVVELKEANA